MPVRDRIVELRRVPAGDLRANPKNWRRHPEAQRSALASILERVGYADALLARETPEGLELVDGHLRAETTPDQEVPVLVLDLDQEEADLILTTLDPLAGMAQIDQSALDELLASLELHTDLFEALKLEASFEPIMPEDQQALDHREPLECPNCGHRWTPT